MLCICSILRFMRNRVICISACYRAIDRFVISDEGDVFERSYIYHDIDQECERIDRLFEDVYNDLHEIEGSHPVMSLSF